MRFVLTDDSLDSHSERVLPEGGILTRFLKLPVMLFQHDRWKAPIGLWKDIRLEGNKLTAEPEFDMDDPLGVYVSKKVDKGYLKAASIGFKEFEKSEDPAMMLPGQKYPTITKWELYEASIVTMGSNENALAEMEKEIAEIKQKYFSDHDLKIKTHETKPENLNPDTMDLKKIAKSLGLKDTATEEEIVAAINAKNAQPAQPVVEETEKPSKALVDSLIELGKSKGVIDEDNQAYYERLAEKDFEGTLQLIDASKKTVKEEKTGGRAKIADALKEAKKELGGMEAKKEKEIEEEEKEKGKKPVSWYDLEKNDPDGLLKRYQDSPEDAQELAEKSLKSVLEGSTNIFKR